MVHGSLSKGERSVWVEHLEMNNVTFASKCPWMLPKDYTAEDIIGVFWCISVSHILNTKSVSLRK